MATAVEPSSEPRTPGAAMSLPAASLIGAIYVVAALAVVFYAVPVFWKDYVASIFSGFTFVQVAARLTFQITVAVGLLWFGAKLAGGSPPVGVRGGIFLMISAAIAIFLVVRWVALNLDGPMGMAVTGVVAVGLLFVAVRFFTGERGRRWMITLEEQGWFSTAQYKRSLGVKVRRLTILGVLLIGGTGVYTIRPETGMLPETWALTMPYDLSPVTVLTDARYAIPLLLLGLTLWIGWRSVNVPSFAEFLIATEAEMNKVSWSTRKRLAQDTVVVLLTTLLMTLFLLVVDLFWGWLLSRQTVGVLPGRATGADKAGQVKEAKW